MKTSSLRSEFVLVGLATMAACLFLTLKHPIPKGGFVAGLKDLGPGGAVLAVAGLVGAAYIFGIVAVQLTFYWPTARLIDNVRSERLKKLRQCGQDLRATIESSKSDYKKILSEAFLDSKPGCPPDPGPGPLRSVLKRLVSLLPKRFASLAPRALADQLKLLFGYPAKQTVAVDLALTIGRAEAGVNVIGEYEYRRSNRQIFVGVLPAIIVAGFGALRHVLPGRSWPAEFALAVAVILATLLACMVTISCAHYQEKVAQAMLLDTAFLAQLSQPADRASLDMAAGSGD